MLWVKKKEKYIYCSTHTGLWASEHLCGWMVEWITEWQQQK